MSASVSITKANIRIPHPEDYGKRGVTIEAYPGDVDDQHDLMVRWFEESEMARMEEIEDSQTVA